MDSSCHFRTKVNTLMVASLWYNFSLHKFNVPVSTFLESPTNLEKNVNISLGVSSVEKHHWYARISHTLYLLQPPLFSLSLSPRGVVVNVLANDIGVSEFERESRYYAHFWTNIIGEGVWILLFSESWVR